MLQSQFASPPRVSAFESPVAVVGFAHNLLIENFHQTFQQDASPLLGPVTRCLRDHGISQARLRRMPCLTVVGLHDPLQLPDQPLMPAPRLSSELGLKETGLTIEAAEASGMAAVHIAKARLAAQVGGFALVVEVLCDASGDALVNILLMQSLGEALSDGCRIHALVQGSAMGHEACAETMLAGCCIEAGLQRTDVLRVDGGRSGGIGMLLNWLHADEDLLAEEGDVSASAGFSVFAPESGTRVTLLLQTPMVAPQLGEDAPAFLRPASEEMGEEEGAFFDAEDHTFDDLNDWVALWGRAGAPEPQTGRTCLGLSWPSGPRGERPMFLSLQQGEV